MDALQFYESFKIPIEALYSAIAIICCAFIYSKTISYYTVSKYKGIKLFANAFGFYGIAFFFRFFAITFSDLGLMTDYSNTTILVSTTLFKFFGSLGGFYLIYSLFWKRLEPTPVSGDLLYRLTHSYETLIYIICFLIATRDFVFPPLVIADLGYTTFSLDSINLMFLAQFFIHIVGVGIAFSNFQTAKEKHKQNFSCMYFIAIALSLTAWGANFLNQFIIPVFPGWRFIVYAITTSIFLIFLYGTLKCSMKRNV